MPTQSFTYSESTLLLLLAVKFLSLLVFYQRRAVSQTGGRRPAGYTAIPDLEAARSHRAATSGFRGALGADRRVPTERKVKDLDRTELE